MRLGVARISANDFGVWQQVVRVDDRRVDQANEWQCEVISMTVDDVELAGPLEDGPEVQSFVELVSPQLMVFVVTARVAGTQSSGGLGVAGREQCDFVLPTHQFLGQQPYELLDRTGVVRP